jgi:hypothetical protein
VFQLKVKDDVIAELKDNLEEVKQDYQASETLFKDSKEVIKWYESKIRSV